jgi:lysophospholipase L1-like esterase
MRYRRSSSFSRIVVNNVSATTLAIRVYSDYPTGQRFLKINKDGVLTKLEIASGSSYLRIDITGITILIITTSTQGNVGGDVQGTYLVSASPIGGSASVAAETNPTPRLLVYGDSIIQGGATVNNGLGTWCYQLRDDIPVIIDGWSGRHLHDDAETEGQRTAYAAQIVIANPSSVWLAVGINDYVNSVWTPAAFGAAYADLLDKIHAALPSAEIYAQTMLDSTSEGVNGLGYTLPNYRTVISDAQSSRSAWCALVDGTAMLDPGTGLLDSVHPNAVGHASCYTYAKTVLGL